MTSIIEPVRLGRPRICSIEEQDKILAMLEKGLKTREIEILTKVSKSTVCRIRQRRALENTGHGVHE